VLGARQSCDFFLHRALHLVEHQQVETAGAKFPSVDFHLDLHVGILRPGRSGRHFRLNVRGYLSASKSVWRSRKLKADFAIVLSLSDFVIAIDNRVICTCKNAPCDLIFVQARPIFCPKG
jgi:hypothetical protein